MTIIRTIIIEDEAASLFFLKEALARYQEIEVIGTFGDGIEGAREINALKPDLVFVDIEIPGINGFQMLQKLEHEPVIIFCTGHKKYALDAWEYDAADFIIKPIQPDRFSKAIQKALEDINSRQQSRRLEKQKLFAGLIEISWIENGYKKSRFFAADEVLFIKSDRDYLIIYLTPGVTEELGMVENQIILKKTMKDALVHWEKFNLFQVHKSYLINLSKITNWNKSDKSIQMQHSEMAIPIGRAYYKSFQTIWNEMI